MAGAQLVLLGTGAGPRTLPDRFGCSAAVVSPNGQTYVFDTGVGSMGQYVTAGLPLRSLQAVLFTHLHSDHVVGLSEYLVNGLFVELFYPDNIAEAVIIGPGAADALPEAVGQDVVEDIVCCGGSATPGTQALVNGIISAFAYDLNIRMRCSGMRDPRTAFAVEEVVLPPTVRANALESKSPEMEPFVVYEDGEVSITAILVDHQTFPSYGYRIQGVGWSVVFAGDTRRCRNLERLAEGASVLVAHPYALDRYDDLARQIVGGNDIAGYLSRIHITPEDAGSVAATAGVGHLVLSHLGPGSTEIVSDDEWTARTRPTFDGPITVGRDLLSIPIGSDLLAAN